MKITYVDLGNMLRDAYELGSSGCSELREQLLEELVDRYKIAKPQELRIYTIEELKKFPIGTKFFHSSLGKGEIVSKKGVKLPFMKFEGGITHGFLTNEFPWSELMMLEKQ